MFSRAMKRIDLKNLSSTYDVRKLTTEDVDMIHAFCASNTQYYEFCGKEISVELIENDLTAVPPGIPMEQKYYVGFFEKNKLVAIMDLVDGYPNVQTVYIGFFMMNHELQGSGIGSKFVLEALEYLHRLGFEKCQLGIDKENPQSNHFWKKNGFQVIREGSSEEGVILIAERQLSSL